MKLLKQAQQQFDIFTNLTKGWNERQDAEWEFEKLPAISRSYKNNITGDACVGDKVAFIKKIWTGSGYRGGKSKLVGFELVEGEIIADSYGADKQQHTFTLKVKGGTLKIKGRNLYAMGLWAKDRDFKEREEALDEKHIRGNAARNQREIRRAANAW